MLSKKTSVVAWFSMVRIGPDGQAVADRLAHVDQQHPHAVGRLRDCSRGVVRHSSSIRSECSARLIQIFWPLTT